MNGTSQLPQPLSTAEARLGYGEVTVVRRHGSPDGPGLVLSNGLASRPTCTGRTGRCWPRTSTLSSMTCAAYGWNAVSPLRRHNLPTLMDDNRRVLEVVDADFGEKPSIGGCHSLSTMVALMHEQHTPTFAALVLFDPPIYPPGAWLPMPIQKKELAMPAHMSPSAGRSVDLGVEN